MNNVHKAIIIPLFLCFIVTTVQEFDPRAFIMNNWNNTEKKCAKIVNGTSATMSEFPFVVALANHDGHQFCGGSILTTKYVLTAAHCISKRNPFKSTVINMLVPSCCVVVSSSETHSIYSGQVRHIKRFLIDPKYIVSDLVYPDVGLVEVKKSFVFGEYCAPVRILEFCPTKLTQVKKIVQNLYDRGSKCTVAGWGHTEPVPIHTPSYYPYNLSAILRKTDLVPIPFDMCHCLAESNLTETPIENEYELTHCNKGKFYNEIITWNMCTLGPHESDACVGDSGGPLICEGKLWAVVSWGFGCGQPNTPSFFARIDPTLQWIHSHVNLTEHKIGIKPDLGEDFDESDYECDFTSSCKTRSRNQSFDFLFIVYVIVILTTFL